MNHGQQIHDELQNLWKGGSKEREALPALRACMPVHKQPSFIIWALVLFAVGIVLYTIGQGMMYGY